jgi:hypothetical protein
MLPNLAYGRAMSRRPGKSHELLQCVLVDLAVLHDPAQVLRVILQHRDVFQRVAFDQEHLGVSA